VRWLAAGIIT